MNNVPDDPAVSLRGGPGCLAPPQQGPQVDAVKLQKFPHDGLRRLLLALRVSMFNARADSGNHRSRTSAALQEPRLSSVFTKLYTHLLAPTQQLLSQYV
jgi:hypothetical protein